MSVHENETTSAVVPTGADVSPADAEQVIAAFLVALRELGYGAPKNTYRAVVTRKGLQVEVFDDARTTTEHYGTPAPVEEVAELLDGPGHWGFAADFAPGDKARVVGNGYPGGFGKERRAHHSFDFGTTVFVVGPSSYIPGHLLVEDINGTWQSVHPSHLERVR